MTRDEAYDILRLEILKHLDGLQHVEGGAQRALAAKLRVSQPYISHLVRCTQDFSFDKILSWCKKLKIDWFATLNKR